MHLSLDDVRLLCRALENFHQSATKTESLTVPELQRLNRLRLLMDRRREYLTRIHSDTAKIEEVKNPYT